MNMKSEPKIIKINKQRQKISNKEKNEHILALKTF